MADEPVAVGEYVFEGRQYLYIGELRTEDDFDEEKREERTMAMVDRLQSHRTWGVSSEGQKGLTAA